MTNYLLIYTDEIKRIWQSMHAIWDEARESWKDIERDEFEREHIQEFSQATNSYIANLKILSDNIQHILDQLP